MAADHGVQLAFAGQLGQIAAKRAQGRGLGVAALFLGAFFARLSRGGGGGFLLGARLGAQLAEDLLAALLDVDVEVLQDARGHAVAFAQQAQKQMLGPHHGVAEGLGLFGGQGQDLLDAGREGDVPHHFLVGTASHLFLDFQPDGFQVQAHLLKYIDGNSLPELDQPQQQVLGSHKVVVEPVRFLPR